MYKKEFKNNNNKNNDNIISIKNSLINNTSLIKLNLSNMFITDEGIYHLLDILSKNSTLKRLNLSSFFIK
jgi:hypothetical protein